MLLETFGWLGIQQAAELLEKTSQTDASAKVASKAVAKAIVQKTVLDHKDKASAACKASFDSQRHDSAAAHVAIDGSSDMSLPWPQDVRVCAAYCLSHILKIHAPDSPYSTAQLQVDDGFTESLVSP